MTSDTKFQDLGGMKEVIDEIKNLIHIPLRSIELLKLLGTSPPRGVLICGQPGTGKTALANAICGELNDIAFYKLNGPEIVSSLSGESESNI
jgi:transitional endoplasmic reticulum ATPase